MKDNNDSKYFDNIRLDMAELDEIDGGADDSKDRRGMPCKRCGTRIPVKLYAVQNGLCNNCYGK